MTGYKVANLIELLEAVGEDRVKSILSVFSCPQNEDVERFLKHSAISFARQGITATYLVFASYRDEPVLVGYFSLANKLLVISKRARLSNTMRRRIAKFCSYNPLLDRHELSAPLIAQLGKNFYNGYNTLITGDELLQMACDRVASVLLMLGGKIAYLECEPQPKLVSF